MQVVIDDGGRKEAGFKGTCGDCCVRAAAIACELPYQEVYDKLNEFQKEFSQGRSRAAKKARKTGSVRNGTYKKPFRKLMESLGWVWTPKMTIGSGCKVHLKKEELPSGRLIAVLSKHYCAVVDGVIHDTYDPSRDETRCVYGYWSPGSSVG